MFNKLSASYHKKHFYNSEDEPPEKKLVSDADIFIKQLSEKQRNTKTNLQEQLTLKKLFHKGNEFRSLTSYTSGSSSLQEFNEVVKSSEQIEKLKSYGLTDNEIELLFDYQQGQEYLKGKHKNMNENILSQKLKNIFHIIKNSTKDIEEDDETSRLKTELILSEKPASLETKLLKFALENQTKSKEKLPHPMDNLKDIEQQFNESISSVNLKKIRKRARNLQKQIDNMPTTGITEPKVPESTNSLAQNSKWDIRELESSKNKYLHTNKTYTCKSQNYYTIKDNQIVRINSPQDTETSRQENKTKLSLEQIKEIPKFKNYSPGEPSNTLYLKNIANCSTEDDLIDVFSKFCNEKISSLKIMKGKMRGQAFIEMETVTAAEHFLKQCNGIIFKNKPIIIQFGKIKNG